MTSSRSAGHRLMPDIQSGHFIYPPYILDERLPNSHKWLSIKYMILAVSIFAYN
nr:MAG TPA: hypothetical protein [Caudoviricetes sp.]